MDDITRLLETASSFLGVTELPRGSNNVIFNTHYYGREVSGETYPWCAAFVWDVFRLAGLSELYLSGGKTASCAAIYSHAKAEGRLISAKELRRGDVVLYKFNRTAAVNHTGIVTYTDNSSLRAIEGNTSVGDDSNGGAVMERERTPEFVVGGYRPLFREDKSLTYEEFEQYMDRYLSIDGTGEACSAWAKKATDTLREQGFVQGSGSDFGWKKPATKETVAQMLYNLMEKGKGVL